MKLLIVADDFPLPPHSGGRTDTWRRMRALKEAGVSIALLTWYDPQRDGPAQPAVLKALNEIVTTHLVYPIKRTPLALLARLAYMGRLPTHATARWIALDRAEVLKWAREFGPEGVLLDRLFGVQAVRWLVGELCRAGHSLPWVYRSHNREASYMAGQLARASGLRTRAGLLLNQFGLERVEREVIHSAGAVLDISLHDAAHWRHQGVADPIWLPPAVDVDFVAEIETARTQVALPRWDALFVGNLNTPNNLEALSWLVDEVLPSIPEPTLRLAVAGSKPAASASAILRRDPRIELIPDPPSVAPLLASAKVLVNPMRSGSGVNLKSVEMLFSDAQLVSTSAGLAGLPTEVQSCFSTADEPREFATAVRAACAAGAINESQRLERHRARAYFESRNHAMTVLQVLAVAAERTR